LLPLGPVAVTLTSILSPAAAEPYPLAFEQWFLAAELTVHESSVAPVVLSMTATRTVSVPVSAAFASPYKLVTVDPPAGVGLARRRLAENPVTAAGESVLSGQIAGKLLERIRERDIPVTATSESAAVAIRAALTERELEIFERLASGESNHEIGRELSLSTNTVSNHIASILAKLHLDNRIQAAVQAVRAGMS
jgi:two-component system, NarL family, response regulator DegU